MRNTFPAGFDLNDQTVVVTGAAAGIGMAIAELFAAQRANLVMLDIAPGVVDAAGKLGARHLGLACDVSDLAQVRAAVAAVDARFGRIDVLVNNAGVALLNKAEDVSEAEWEKTMAVNLKAPFFPGAGGRQGDGPPGLWPHHQSRFASQRHSTRSPCRVLREQGGAGFADRRAGDRMGGALDHRQCGSPTVVETALGKQAWAGEVGEAMKKKIPLGRFALPEEIASAILFLASTHAGMMTGANLIIDGGYTIQ